MQALLAAADAMKTLEVDDVLEWAWDCIVEPVLRGPRVWAGRQRQATRRACGGAQQAWPLSFRCMPPSLTPSSTPARSSALDLRDIVLHALASHADPGSGSASQRKKRHLPGPLIVAMPQTPGLPALESAIRRGQQHFPALASEYEMLTGTSATRNAVAQAMPRHQWAHFACHGSQDLGDPFSGALHLHDGPLAIAQ